MLYSKDLLIPSGTQEDTPVRAVLPVCEGIVSRVWVRWRWGPGNLCGVRAYYAEFQHWPMSPGEWFPSTTHDLVFDDALPLLFEPLQLVIEGYNLDDVYPHRVWMAFQIDRQPRYEPIEWTLEPV